jgi:hypothetical protein
MSVRDLKKPSQTNWARIDQMTDEEIDTSDIPPLDDAFFAAAQLRLPRLSIYLFDLREARKFADYILKRTLHSKKSELRQLELLAFNTSLIISYSRPFKRSYNSKDEGKSSLAGYEKKVLDEDEVKLHRRILGLRDRAYAHSDASSHLFEGFDYSKFVAFYRPIEILDKSATEQLKLIIGKWISYLETKKSKLKESQTQRT